MKKIFSILSISLFLTAFISLQSFAEVGGEKTRSLESKTYVNSVDFLKAEGNTCEVATDGCNTIQISNGELGAMTKMWCEDIYGENGQEKWSCKQEKEDTGEEYMRVCTMEYSPVCGVDRVTYGNACMAGDTKIVYKGECDTMIDTKRMMRLEALSEKFRAKVQNISLEKRTKAIEIINQRIEMVKMSRIVVSIQKERITDLTFLKNILENTPYSK